MKTIDEKERQQKTKTKEQMVTQAIVKVWELHDLYENGVKNGVKFKRNPVWVDFWYVWSERFWLSIPEIIFIFIIPEIILIIDTIKESYGMVNLFFYRIFNVRMLM